MKKILFLLAFCGLIYSGLNAQYYYDRTKNPEKAATQKVGRDFDTYYSFAWDINSPLSNQNYISQASTLGTRISFRKRLNSVDKLWIGADLGWAVYQQHVPYRTYQYSSTTVATELFNYAYNYSVAATIDYFLFPTDRLVVPYAGVGIGVAYDKFTQYYGIYGGNVSSFGLQLRPEVGLLIGFKENSSWRIKVAGHFDYASNSAKLTDNNFITPGNDNYNGFMNLGVQVGIVKMAW